MLKLRMVDRNILDHYTDLPVGEVLRRARVQYGMELSYVGAHLNLRPEHLAAIEAGDVSRLPGRVYAIGFVRTYADFLKLDSDKIVYLFKSQCIGHTSSRALNFPTPVTETRSPALWMVAASLGTLVVVGLLIWLLGGGSADSEAKPELPEVVAQTQAKPTEKPELEDAPLLSVAEQEARQTAEDDQAKIAAAQTPPGKLKITAQEASWVEVRPADAPETILFSRVLKAGESYSAPENGNLLLSTGNAEGVTVFWDGKTVDVFEGRKGIVRDLPVSGLTAYKIRAAEPEPADANKPQPKTQAPEKPKAQEKPKTQEKAEPMKAQPILDESVTPAPAAVEASVPVPGVPHQGDFN